MSRLTEIALGTARTHDMLPEGARVLAMVSGGADSVALLRLLDSGALGAIDLSVLHVDHMLRGEASDGDAAFVEDLCARLGVSCRTVRYDVSSFAAGEGLNLEDAGRRVRYRFAEEEVAARCATAGHDAALGRIAVAHTFDDRMETFLMRVAQGAGAGGLASIGYVRGRIVRPLLDARRADVLEHLRELGQEWREDATNADTSRLRARVRSELLPLLESVNPRFDGALARTLAILSDEDELLDRMARDLAVSLAETRAGELRVDGARILALPRAMQRRVMRAALFDAYPEASRLEHSHLEALLGGLTERGFSRDLSGGLRAADEYGTLVVRRGECEAGPLAPSLLDVPGTVDLGQAGCLRAEPTGPEAVTDDPMCATVDADRLAVPLTVDSVGPGDRMRPLGMRGTRKLSDVLTDAKVPRRARPVTPVVRSGGEVVWVAGTRLSEDYRVRTSTRRAVRLSWTGPARQEENE